MKLRSSGNFAKSGKNFLLTQVLLAVFGILAFSSMSSSFVHANASTTTAAATTDNSTATNANATVTTSAAPVATGLCVNVTTVTPTNVTSTVNVTSVNATDNSTSTSEQQVTALQNVTTIECVACENVTKEKSVTVTSVNATDNSTISTTSLQNVTECVPIPATTAAPSTSAAPVETTDTPAETTKITGALDLTMTVPAGTTITQLNSNDVFKTALAKSIKAALSLGATATVVVKTIAAKAAAATTTSPAASRMLRSRRSLSGTSLDLDVSYEITLPKADAEAVFTKIADSATFATAVKTNAVSELSTAGLTGYTVDAVVAREAEGALKPAPAAAPAATDATTEEDDAVGSGAFSNFSSGSLSTVVLLVGSVFSMKLASA
jgi:hypothetical protein